MFINYLLGGLVLGAMLWAIVYLIRKRKQGGCAGCPGCGGECGGHCAPDHPSDT